MLDMFGPEALAGFMKLLGDSDVPVMDCPHCSGKIMLKDLLQAASGDDPEEQAKLETMMLNAAPQVAAEMEQRG